MSKLYEEIINWSVTQPIFMQDAIRRFLNTSVLTESDINDLLLLVKQEVGFTGISLSAIPAKIIDIPTNSSNSVVSTKLLSIGNPVNISALYSNATVNFVSDGLTVVYGNNGSGKSSYARILKKLCWSRNRNIELKKNVYTNDKTTQSVKIKLNDSTTDVLFDWQEGQPTLPALNSVYLFDSDCAEVYLNNETPTEYRPVGIEILENLISVCTKIDNSLDLEIKTFTTQKPALESPKYDNTQIALWYNHIETINDRAAIEAKLVFPDTNVDRKSELLSVLQQNNPAEENLRLRQKIARYNTVKESLELIEYFFSSENRILIENIKQNYNSKRQAYQVAKDNISGNDPLTGIGSETWRELWFAAKKYATTEVHPLFQDFPIDKSAEFCVLCQQPLNDKAKNRLSRFNTFILDQTSAEFAVAESALKEKIEETTNVELLITDTVIEINSDITGFDSAMVSFQTLLKQLKQEYTEYLSGHSLNLQIGNELCHLSSIVLQRMNEINTLIQANDQLIRNRTSLENELLELDALEFLAKNKIQILKYYDEYWQRYWLNQCKTKVNTRSVSIKIGELLSSNAIALQHTEFIKHLDTLNPSISTKVSIKRTKTSSGTTFQKCTFRDISESIPAILSEGEQKIVALANFLSECTIDGRNNTIVFDDPVNSLDQNYREAIANKIVTLSQNRQVIVLTHDLYFLRLLMDVYESVTSKNCCVIGLMESNGISGIPSDEIPYLVKNVQARIDTINKNLTDIGHLQFSQITQKETLLVETRLRFRLLLERSVEEVLLNRTIERFSKNIKLKRGNIATLAVVEKTDIDFLLALFGKYSVPEHDGTIETLSVIPNEKEIKTDLNSFSDWRNSFQHREKDFKKNNGYV